MTSLAAPCWRFQWHTRNLPPQDAGSTDSAPLLRRNHGKHTTTTARSTTQAWTAATATAYTSRISKETQMRKLFWLFLFVPAMAFTAGIESVHHFSSHSSYRIMLGWLTQSAGSVYGRAV